MDEPYRKMLERTALALCIHYPTYSCNLHPYAKELFVTLVGTTLYEKLYRAGLESNELSIPKFCASLDGVELKNYFSEICDKVILSDIDTVKLADELLREAKTFRIEGRIAQLQGFIKQSEGIISDAHMIPVLNEIIALQKERMELIQ